MHGDCLQKMKDIKDKSIDMILTSPPYDNLRTYNGYTFNFEPIAHELFRVLKDGRHLVWVVGDETKDFCESLTSFKQAIYFVENIGFKLLDTMIYQKLTPMPISEKAKRYVPCFEYIFVLTKGKPKIFNPIREKSKQIIFRYQNFRQKDGSQKKKILREPKELKLKNNLFSYLVGNIENETDKYEHPATFPNKLARDMILSYSNEKETIFDPFMGSGTTGIIAHKLNRDFIGIEISEEYYNLSKQRIERATNQLNLDFFY
jgi:site-specific DNA-methyltransferase (adenine-specific)